MSDEEELHRWAAMYGEAEPLGETLVDLGSDLYALGLTPDGYDPSATTDGVTEP